MSALKIQHTLHEIERNMTELAPYRKSELFKEFLVQGYSAITLTGVPAPKVSELLQAKLCLGTLITLYDDFADRPTRSDPMLLEVLYKLNFEGGGSVETSSPSNLNVLRFAKFLFAEMERVLSRQPHYGHLKEVLNFDLKHFYSANQYSSLLMANPYIKNSLENKLYAHHNMGVVMVAMIDLMATEKIQFSEFGFMREVFLMGQRMGRIFNVLSTYKREALDGDITGELATYSSEREIRLAKRALRKEICELHDGILAFDNRITTFSVKAYANGLMKVQKLHERMEGVI